MISFALKHLNIRRQLMSVGFVCLGCVATALAADTSLGGDWKVNTDITGRKDVLSLTLVQDGDKLSGTVNNPDGKNQAITGSVEGKKVTWQYDAAYKLMKLTMVYEGEMDEAQVVKGVIKIRPFGGGGSFVAKRSTASSEQK